MSENIWAQAAARYVSWMRPWKTLCSGGFDTGDVQWFKEGQLNVSVNCLDRHLPSLGDSTALIHEGDEENASQYFTFRELHREVCRMANGLKSLGLKKGDRVGIYLPMIPEAAFAMLACARLGLVHTVVFAGFSAQALHQRLQAAECRLLITTDHYCRGGKFFDLKQQAEQATRGLNIPTLVITKADNTHSLKKGDILWNELKIKCGIACEPERVNAEDPFFILYTSGSTGKPKGLVHTTGGYLVQTAYSQDVVFKCRPKDIFWCTADIGWITGHSYVIYGPLCNGVTTLMHAGTPAWPDPSRCWKIIDRHKVSVFYTAPTAVRALKKAGDEWLQNSSRASLRMLGTVGEPMNPEVWEWYRQQVGHGSIPVIDTWWQTETGAIMISPQRDEGHDKPGFARKPLPGIDAVILNEQGQAMNAGERGALAIRTPWPSLARTITGDHARYCKTYFRHGCYLSGDGAIRDDEGDYLIFGRMDDVLNVSGHRLGTAEIESALLSHPAVAEAAVVGIPHPVKGEGICAFVSLKTEQTADLTQSLTDTVKSAIGALAKPDIIQYVQDLPKTRSGKIMRRILRQFARNEVEELDDLSTLANPHSVDELKRLKWERLF